jgi:ribonucleoside-triphosphate reductase
MESKHYCHDCKKELVKDDFCYSYKAENKEFVKCEECHQKDPSLRNFRVTEVYSRVVGYIRPVEQWNKGKRSEFGDRVEFVVEQKGCASC